MKEKLYILEKDDGTAKDIVIVNTWKTREGKYKRKLIKLNLSEYSTILFLTDLINACNKRLFRKINHKIEIVREIDAEELKQKLKEMRK